MRSFTPRSTATRKARRSASPPPRRAPARLTCALALLGAGVGGCLERKLAITTEPPGALVWVNDVEVGRTPVEADFTFYGEYDVRVRLDGYEPLITKATASQPLYEYPPLDLLATIAPWRVKNTVRWHFTLEPTRGRAEAPEEFERDLLQRARELREQVEPPPDR